MSWQYEQCGGSCWMRWLVILVEVWCTPFSTHSPISTLTPYKALKHTHTHMYSFPIKSHPLAYQTLASVCFCLCVLCCFTKDSCSRWLGSVPLLYLNCYPESAEDNGCGFFFFFLLSSSPEDTQAMSKAAAGCRAKEMWRTGINAVPWYSKATSCWKPF